MFDIFKKKKEKDAEEAAEKETTAAETTEEDNEPLEGAKPRNKTAVAAGVTNQAYDMEPATPEQVEEVFEGEEGIEIQYSFNGDEIKNALTVFQHETMFKKNMIFTLVLAAVFGVYTFNIMQSEANGTSIFLAVMCIATIAFIWYMPWNHRRQVAKAIDANPMEFKVTVYDSGILIQEENSSCKMKFGNEINKIAETEESFLFFAGKERLFVLPKRFIGDQEALKEKLIAAMGDQYIVRIKNAK